MSACLVPLSSDINGVILNPGKKVIVGRNTTASHYIISKSVSKEHLSLQEDEENNWTVEDLQSLNGTYINEVKIDPYIRIKLKEGDIVDIVKPYKYKFTKDTQEINKIIAETNSIPTLNVDDRILELKRPPMQSNKVIKNATTDEDGIEPPSLKKSRLNNFNDIPGTCKLNLGSPIKNRNALIKCEKTYPPTLLLKNKFTNQLKTEIIAKEELISILRMDFKKKKDKWEKEKVEQEESLKMARNAQMKLEAQIEQLLEQQKDMTVEIQNKQDVEKSLRHQIEKLNKHQKLLSSTIERQDSELAELRGSKETLQIELDKCEVERLELLKNFEHSFNTENKLTEQKDEIIRHMTVTIESEFQCVICQDLMIKATVMNCGHIFCKACLETWLQTKKECPVCRKHYQQKNHLLLLDNYLDGFVDRYGTEDFKAKRAEVKAQREQRAAAAATSSASGQHRSSAGSTRARNAASNVNGSFRRLWDLRNEINANTRLLRPSGNARNRRRQRSLHFGLGPSIDNALAQLGTSDTGVDTNNELFDISDIWNEMMLYHADGLDSTRRHTRGSGPSNRNNAPYRLRSSGRMNSDNTDVITINDTAGPSSAPLNPRASRSNAPPAPRDDPEGVIYIFENGEGESFSTDFSASDSPEPVSAPLPTRRRTRRVGHVSRPRDPHEEEQLIMSEVTTTDDDEVIQLGDESTAFEGSDDDADDNIRRHGNRRRGNRRHSDLNDDPVAITTDSVPVNQRQGVTSTAICPRCHRRGHISRHCPQNRA